MVPLNSSGNVQPISSIYLPMIFPQTRYMYRDRGLYTDLQLDTELTPFFLSTLVQYACKSSFFKLAFSSANLF